MKKAYSLLELLAVVAIIMVLAALGAVNYRKAMSGAHEAVNAANDKERTQFPSP